MKFAGSALNALLFDQPVSGALPAIVIPADCVMERWAVSVGNGLPSELWDDTPRARLPPLDDETAILVDQTYMRAPDEHRRILQMRYKSRVPTRILAEDWDVSERTIQRWHVDALKYMHDRLVETRHPPLLKMLLVRV